MVEKDRFNYLINNYNSLSQEETAELRLEQDHYGYCQVLHQLIARGDQDNQTEMKEQSLHIAAVYSTDRSVFKQVMTAPRADRVEITPPPLPKLTVEIAVKEEISVKKENTEEATSPTEEKEKVTEKVAPPPESITEETAKKEPQIPKSESNFDADVALNKFIEGLKPMHEKKLEFEKAIAEFEKKMSEATPIEGNVVTNEERPEKESKPKRRGRPRKVASDENVNTSEKLLDEIKTSKKKVASDNKKQKEQSEIIEQFIKSKPSISKPTSQQQQLDLSEQNESYNENVVSETLALILIKQGKKEKAIEVLKKLIWKFPQKKAYFAAQIEDLTK